MSGGEYDYAYIRIESYADEMKVDTENRKRFQELLYLVADAAKNIEWVDSGNFEEGAENPAINRCFENVDYDERVKNELQKIMDGLDNVLKEARNERD